MSDSISPQPEPDGLGAALGRIPSGLFILTVRNGHRSTGMLASWVQQAGFDPPMVTVALQKDRYVGEWVRESGKFVLNQIPAGNKALLRHFAKGFGPDESAFEGLETSRVDEPAGPVLDDALAYLVVNRAGELVGSDHVVVLGTVVSGRLLAEKGEPMVHVRRDGFHY